MNIQAITTQKQFEDKLRGFKVSATAMRENLQLLIEYGLTQYKDHSNTTPLSSLMEAVSHVATVPAKTIKAYIGKYANVMYTKDKKSGKMVFKKAAKGDPIVTMPEVSWFADEVNKKNDAKPDYTDPVAVIKAAIKRIAEAHADELIAPGREDLAREMVNILAKYDQMDALPKAKLKLVETPAAAQQEAA